MILLESAKTSTVALDGLLLFAEQLQSLAHTPVIDEACIPDDAGRSQFYDAAPYLASIDDLAFERAIILGAEEFSEETLLRLRRVATETDCPVSAVGNFDSNQRQIAAAARIAYAIGREPTVVNLSALGIPPLRGGQTAQVGVGNAPSTGPRDCPSIFLVIAADQFEGPLTLSLLGALAQQRGFSTSVVTSGGGKALLRDGGYAEISAFGYSDLTPLTLAARADTAVFLGDGIPGDRMAHFAIEMMASSKVVIDATTDAALLGTGAPAIQGPKSLGAAAVFLEQTVLPNLKQLGTEAGQSDWIARRSFGRLAQEIGLKIPSVPPRQDPSKSPQTIFVPTNGVGLGHAKRCTLIASEIRPAAQCSFLAFPSCVPMIQAKGIAALPLVGRSDHHEMDIANDLLNYLRMRRTLRAGDTLVFDGGYVFESIYRSILERNLNAVWIRRGLWRAGQSRTANLEREKAFRMVIVPDEAFAENRVGISFGPHVRNVGPIVDRNILPAAEVAALRGKLAERFGIDFERLVVTMLGGGIAADRTAHIQAISNFVSARSDCLHLVVAWPGARLPAGLATQANTFLVRSQKTVALSQCADVTVSAAGYNSFHEMLYNRVPTILVPQVAPILDDQEARARAASDRGVAVTVMASELLRLERELRAFLDDGKGGILRAELQKLDLPEPGNKQAAELIAEAAQNG